jgi:hypothetical protein
MELGTMAGGGEEDARGRDAASAPRVAALLSVNELVHEGHRKAER